MDAADEIETLATAAGLLYKKRHKETSSIVLSLATDIALKQDEESQKAFISRLDMAFKKGKDK